MESDVKANQESIVREYLLNILYRVYQVNQGLGPMIEGVLN